MPGLQVVGFDDEDELGDAVADDFGDLNVVSMDGPDTAPPSGNGPWWLDTLLGLGEGATLNHGAELGAAGSKLGTWLMDAAQPSLERDGMAPEYAGERGASAQELVDRSQRTTAGQLGKLGGLVATSTALPGAVGGARAAAGGLQAARAAANVAPTMATTLGAGAASGAAAAGGDTGHDPLAMLLGGGAGMATAGLGGALAQGAKAPAWMPVPGGPKGMEQLGTRGEQALGWLGNQATQLGTRSAAGAGLGMLLGGSQDPIELAKNAAKGAVGAGLLGYAGSKLPGMAPALPGMLQRGGSAASGLAGAMSAPSSAQAQEKAYGTAPTMSWAVQSVLAGGDSGLAPMDEQRLTEAVLSGDEDRVIAANFTLQQKSPAYAARLQRELESLQEE